MKIKGVNHSTIMSIMSEILPDASEKFPTSNHFTSWLRLATNNKISGRKLLSSKTLKGSNRLKIALRNAVNTVGNLHLTCLSDFFRKTAVLES
jgi:hypothetical protein